MCILLNWDIVYYFEKKICLFVYLDNEWVMWMKGYIVSDVEKCNDNFLFFYDDWKYLIYCLYLYLWLLNYLIYILLKVCKIM